MAFLNEFPHVDANKLNLDWLLEQYSTFDQRLQEVHNHFDEVAEAMERSNEEYQQALTNAFNAFKQEVERESYTVERTLETINNNMTEYVGEHMTEWQIASSRASILLNDYIGEYTVPNIQATGHDIVLYDYFWATRDPETNELFRNYGNMEDLKVRITNDDEFVIQITAPIATATCYVHYSII